MVPKLNPLRETIFNFTRLNASLRSALARGVSFALGFSFVVNIQLIGGRGQTKALDEQNMYSEFQICIQCIHDTELVMRKKSDSPAIEANNL